MKQATLPLHQAASRMVIDPILKREADNTYKYFQTLVTESKSAPSTAALEAAGFTSVGGAELIPDLKLKLEQAKAYHALVARYPGYMIVHKKHMLAWMLANNLYVSEFFKFAGIVPKQNEADFHIFNTRILKLEDVNIEAKTTDKWEPLPAAMRTKYASKLEAARQKGLHTINGERIKFDKPARGSRWNSWDNIEEANVRAIAPYMMIADYGFFDHSKEQEQDSAMNAAYTPDPDPLIMLPSGEFYVVVTAWGHEEQLKPGLQKIIKDNI